MKKNVQPVCSASPCLVLESCTTGGGCNVVVISVGDDFGCTSRSFCFVHGNQQSCDRNEHVADIRAALAMKCEKYVRIVKHYFMRASVQLLSLQCLMH